MFLLPFFSPWTPGAAGVTFHFLCGRIALAKQRIVAIAKALSRRLRLLRAGLRSNILLHPTRRQLPFRLAMLAPLWRRLPECRAVKGRRPERQQLVRSIRVAGGAARGRRPRGAATGAALHGAAVVWRASSQVCILAKPADVVAKLAAGRHAPL